MTQKKKKPKPKTNKQKQTNKKCKTHPLCIFTGIKVLLVLYDLVESLQGNAQVHLQLVANREELLQRLLHGGSGGGRDGRGGGGVDVVATKGLSRQPKGQRFTLKSRRM